MFEVFAADDADWSPLLPRNEEVEDSKVEEPSHDIVLYDQTADPEVVKHVEQVQHLFEADEDAVLGKKSAEEDTITDAAMVVGDLLESLTPAKEAAIPPKAPSLLSLSARPSSPSPAASTTSRRLLMLPGPQPIGGCCSSRLSPSLRTRFVATWSARAHCSSIWP